MFRARSRTSMDERAAQCLARGRCCARVMPGFQLAERVDYSSPLAPRVGERCSGRGVVHQWTRAPGNVWAGESVARGSCRVSSARSELTTVVHSLREWANDVQGEGSYINGRARRAMPCQGKV